MLYLLYKYLQFILIFSLDLAVVKIINGNPKWWGAVGRPVHSRGTIDVCEVVAKFLLTTRCLQLTSKYLYNYNQPAHSPSPQLQKLFPLS